MRGKKEKKSCHWNEVGARKRGRRKRKIDDIKIKMEERKKSGKERCQDGIGRKEDPKE